MDRMRHVRALLSRISLSWPLLCFVFIVFWFLFTFTRAFQRKRPSWNSGLVFFFRSVANRSQLLITYARCLDCDACATFWLMSIWYGVKADEEKLSRCKISADILYNTLKTHTKYEHIVRGRATLKNVEHFPNKSVREPYEKSLYEWSFISGPFSEEHAINWVIQC